jgi:hypothetical protein
MAKIDRLYDFANGKRADAEQVDDELNNLVEAHNAQDDALAKKVDIDGDFQGTWNGVAFEEADPAIAGRVTNVENMVKEEPKVTVTLKRGENIIEAPENVTLTPLKILGDEVKNLALLFDHWTLHANAVKDSSDKVTLNAGGPNEVSSLKVEVKRNQDYVYSMKHTGMIAVLDATLSETAVVAYTTEQVIKFNSGNNSIIHLAFKSNNDESGTFTFEAPALVEGTEERESVQTYQPVRGPYIEVDNGSYIYFDEYLYKGDELYLDEQGNWRKKQNKIESILTAENFKNPSINTSYTGGKAIKIPLSEIAKDIDIYETELIKFNHTFLSKTDSAANITNDRYYVDNDSLLLFVSSDITGWQDDPAPPAEGQPKPDPIPSKLEIMAFLLGWKMAHTDGTVPYVEANKVTKGVKKWIRIIGEGESTTLPKESYHEWNPFKLIYGTMSEQDVPAKHEGGLRLSKGTNKVTLGEGIVLREIVTPVISGNDYVIGDTETSYQIEKVIEVTKTGKKDDWVLSETAKTDEVRFDSVAFYQITYKVKNDYAYTCHAGDTQAKHAPNFHVESNEQAKEIQELKNKLAQHSRVIFDNLGRKNGIALLGKNGTPLKSDGSPSIMRKEYVTWKDTSTTLVKTTGTYTKTLNIPSDGFWYRLIMRDPNNGRVHVYEWDDDVLSKTNNAPYCTYDTDGMRPYPEPLKYGYSTEFTTFGKTYEGTNNWGGTYVRSRGYLARVDLKPSELSFFFKNLETDMGGTLSIDLVLEVLFV